MAKIHGKGGYAIIEGLGIITQLHGWSLNFNRDTSPTPQQGYEWVDSIRGQGHWGGALSIYYDGANLGNLYDIVNSTTEKDVYLYPQKSDTTKYFYGDAWADVDFSVPVDGPEDISVTLTGTGQLLEEGVE